ncbi:MAG: QueT transporter family protein [Candidatus Coatesbacteria bacterium]|nr:QueT transporter family protein [Candidatus Coatesbacteria bacterium]
MPGNRELFSMWANTRMIVLTAVIAALYVCLLLPFKGLILVPGFTEIRPAALVPLFCSLLFGPAAAWGAAIGNVVGDLFGGMFGLGSIPGFLGNFMLGYLPYKLLQNIFRSLPANANYFQKMLVGVFAAVSCGVIIAWGVDLLGLVPFAVLGSAISTNNTIMAALYPFVFALLFQRVARMGLLHSQIMPERQPRSGLLPQVVGPFLVIAGALGGLACGLMLNAGQAPESIKLIVTPFVAAIFIGCLML